MDETTRKKEAKTSKENIKQSKSKKALNGIQGVR